MSFAYDTYDPSQVRISIGTFVNDRFFSGVFAIGPDEPYPRDVGVSTGLVRYSLYILVFAVFVQVAISWVNPDAPLAPLFDMVTRPFLRPLRRYVPPVGRVDLTPLVLLVILYVLLIPLNHLRLAAAAL